MRSVRAGAVIWPACRPRRNSKTQRLLEITLRNRARTADRRRGAMPAREGFPYNPKNGTPVLPNQFEPLPYALAREVNPAEEQPRCHMTDLVWDRLVFNRFERPFGGGRTIRIQPRV